MSQAKKVSVGPVQLTAAAANYVNPPAASGGVGITSAQAFLLWSLKFVNTDTATHTIKAYKGATAGSAAGTEIIPPGIVLAVAGAAGSEYVETFSPPLRFEAADFLTAFADTTLKVNLIATGEAIVTG